MKQFKFSIRAVLAAILGATAVLVIGLSFYSTHQFHSLAYGFHRESLQSLMGVLAQRELHALEQKSGELSQLAQTGGKLRRQLRRPDKLVEVLNNQFHQKYVTLGIVKLCKLRIYDPDLNPIAQSSEGEQGLHFALPSSLRDQAAGREGADRMKRIDALWGSGGRAFHSVLVPIGGLRLSGYLEVVADPIQQLRQMHGIIEHPLRLLGPSGEEHFTSEDWKQQRGEHHAVVDTPLNGDDGTVALRVEVLSDLSILDAGNDTIRLRMLGLFGGLITALIGLVVWLLRGVLFRPTARLITTMKRAATGELTVHPGSYVLRELDSIAIAFVGMLEAMRGQVLSVRQGGSRVSQETAELKQIAVRCTETAQRQQDGVGRVASAMTQMAASAHEVAKSAEETAGNAQQMDRDAAGGAIKAREAASGVEALIAELGTTAEAIDRLGAETADVDTILDVIRGIADQTNLLALNASIEAARAGEQGRGFAVVADEVRSLAQKTQESTVDIQQRLEGLQRSAGTVVETMQEAQLSAGNGRDRVQEVASALKQIERSVAKINDMTAQIASAAEQQSKVSEEVSRDATEIHTSAEETATAASQIEQTADDLTRLAGELEGNIARFKV